MRRFLSLLLAFSFALLAPDSASAQSVLPEAGDRAITFGLPSGGGAGFGLRWMQTETRNFGLDVELDGVFRSFEDEDDEDETDFSVVVSPNVRWYRGDQDGPVVPFIGIDGRLGYSTTDGRGAPSFSEDLTRYELGASAFVGVEWFPLEAISIAGSTGFGVSWFRERADDERFAPFRDVDSLELRAFRSDLRISLWY